MPPIPDESLRSSRRLCKILVLGISGLGVLLLPFYWLIECYGSAAIRDSVGDFVDQYFLLCLAVVGLSFCVLIDLVMQWILPPKRLWLGRTVLAVAIVALFVSFLLMAVIEFSRTGGWEYWNKTLDGHVNDKGAAVFPVYIKWNFVDLTFEATAVG